MRKHSLGYLGMCAISVALCGAGTDSAPSKKPAYPLTKNNGPWMIMVKSFQGPEAIEVANQLARELREEHKIPAYVLAQRADTSKDLQAAGLERGRVRQHDSAAVLAGDFPTEEDKAAVKLRDRIRQIPPKCITPEMTSRYRWEVGVLSTAFLVRNPLAPKPATTTQKIPPFLLKLNSGKNSLLNCPGSFSLQVISFSGATALTAEQEQQIALRKKTAKISLLEAAGQDAEFVAAQLLKQGHEAYVFHGLSSSIVCVGNFSSDNDPRIEQLRSQMAGARVGNFNLSPYPIVVAVPNR